jgi:DMSO/TMAO reductase YedYZ molybdopterin-dependent catalytic subunit
MAADATPWNLDQLYALPQFTQITRHFCIGGWSAIGKWTGVRFYDFLARNRRRHVSEIGDVPLRR